MVQISNPGQIVKRLKDASKRLADDEEIFLFWELVATGMEVRATVGAQNVRRVVSWNEIENSEIDPLLRAEQWCIAALARRGAA